MDNMGDEGAMGRGRKSLCRPLRDMFGVVVAVATVSVVISYHMSRYLPARQQTELQIRLRGRLDIYRQGETPPAGNHGADTSGRHGNSVLADRRQGLEGMDVEDLILRHQRRRQRLGSSARLQQPRPELVALLRQVDAEMTGSRDHPRLAILLGDPDTQTDSRRAYTDTQTDTRGAYTQALQGARYSVITPATANMSEPHTAPGNHDDNHRGYSRQLWDTGWSLGICLRPSGDTSSSQHHHHVNLIPALDSMFATRGSFCATMTTARYIPAIYASGSALSPLCYVFPDQYEDFLTEAQTRGTRDKWVLKPLEPGLGPVQLVEPTNDRDFYKIKRLQTKATLVQQYVSSPLPLFGLPFTVTVYVLVSSWRPLRLHLHSHGLVHFRHDYQRNFRKIVGRTWTLDQWLHHVTETRGAGTAEVARRNMESVVTQTLLVTEVVEGDHGSLNHRCQGCFQLLSFELIFNSTFYPMVLNIASVPDMSEAVRRSDMATGVKSNPVIQDLVAVVTSSTPVVMDVAMAIEELSLDVSLSSAGSCDDEKFPNTISCLDESDLVYLMSLRRETRQKTGFKLLYPALDAEKYSKLTTDLQKYSDLRHHNRHPAPGPLDSAHLAADWSHSTADLQTLSVAFLRYLHNLERMEEAYDDLNIPLFADQQLPAKDSDLSLLENVAQNNSSDDSIKRPPCLDDRELMPYISEIHSDPPLSLSPEFNKSVTEYFATVPYDVFLLKVWAHAVSCYSEARLENKYGLSRPTNFPLGLGANSLSVLVVDHSHTEPWTLTTYRLTVYREEQTSRTNTSDQVVCSLVQDCQLVYLPAQPCGLQQTAYRTWARYQAVMSTLPACHSADQDGRWMVACDSCERPESCRWSDAVWQPHVCRHVNVPRGRLREGLRGKQVLFIGDSTNRGMMHYLMEQVNGSLTEWDKTHDVVTYTNLNQASTYVSFTYYPQFWLAASQRPPFDRALAELIQQARPLDNNPNTVLVIGGVHWLATQHLKVVVNVLRREGLEHIRVIVKGLGAGFHQPVQGLHCLTLAEQQKLVFHNADLAAFSKSQGFHFIDTFNMTMARYRDFLQGKCACHFHRVREVLPSFTQYMRSSGDPSHLPDMPILYHVEGNINAAYSEMLVNAICGPQN